MLHLKNLINTLGLCVCAVLLLLVPATSNAMPADDEHFALPHSDATVLPGDGQGTGAAADGTTCSMGSDAPMGTECAANCDRSRDGCVSSCPTGLAGYWCVGGCIAAHGFCVMGCAFTSY